MNIQEQITGTTERIVIDYANLSGRESANRAEFRNRTEKHIKYSIKSILEGLVEREKENKKTGFFSEHDSTDHNLIGYNKAKQDTIYHLQSLIKSLEE